MDYQQVTSNHDANIPQLAEILTYETVEVYIDEENIPSVKLFENLGFTPVFRDGKMINYVYTKE